MARSLARQYPLSHATGAPVGRKILELLQNMDLGRGINKADPWFDQDS
jgi:hypothetical protein